MPAIAVAYKKKTAKPKASSQAWRAMKREAIKTVTAAPLIPPHPTLRTLRETAATCKACDLWKTGTQTVFGEGSQHASVMFVGEQPGDREDLAGRPFVGPAGKLLDQALAQVGIDRRNVYVTNVVKHFKWVPDERSKRRIHKKPRYSEINALPSLAGRGTSSSEASDSGLSRSNRGPGATPKRIQRESPSRRTRGVRARALRDGNSPSVFDITSHRS